MPNINLLVIPTVIIAVALFVVGLQIANKRMPIYLAFAWTMLSVLAAVPAILFISYYGHWLDRCAWFYAFRAMPGSELAASGAGLGAGIVALRIQRLALRHMSAALVRFVFAMQLLFLILLLCAPYAKPVLAPIQIAFRDQWRDGICIQSTPSTCGPSSAATILKYFGLSASERELALECYSYGGGTENWYVARALKRRGLDVSYVVSKMQPTGLPFPSIAGTEVGGLGGAGHFVAILGREGERYVVGDPIVGKLLMTIGDLRKRYFLTGFFLVVQPHSGTEQHSAIPIQRTGMISNRK